MPEDSLARWQDVLVIVVNLGLMVAIGVYCARKTRSADAYFLANRNMPGWVVAVSMMATIISSVSFLAIPGSTFQDDWRFIPGHALYFIPAIVGYVVFMPFFRSGQVRSAYEYLERRFGTWARLYGAVAFLLHHMFRIGIILYAVSLAFQRLSGVELAYVVCILGILVAAYTIAGGLEAVIYTDFLQGLALVTGGLLCLPILANLLPGGLGQVFTEAYADGKFSVGSTAFVFDQKTVWVIVLVLQFQFLQMVCTDQTMVQRYLAMRTDRQARRGFVLGTVLIILVWTYFAFVGTALYVFYKHYPATVLHGAEPEGVLPYFILTEVPAGVAGFVLAGLLAAAMSTLDSSINASAATVTTDFYRRFRPNAGGERHYLKVGRWFSLLFSLIMIGVALVIHFNRTETLMDIALVFYSVVSAGLLSLFLLGFFTVRVGSRAAGIATCATVLMVVVWMLLTTDMGKAFLPDLAESLPNTFWVGVVPPLFQLVTGCLLSFLLPRPKGKTLENLTIWTKQP